MDDDFYLKAALERNWDCCGFKLLLQLLILKAGLHTHTWKCFKVLHQVNSLLFFFFCVCELAFPTQIRQIRHYEI